jgi:alkylation response protein AidB-like acyl-CoA dehydrogenase
VVSGPDEHKLGLDGSSTTELILEDVRVPVENVLGTIGEGHRVAFNILNLGRVKLGTRNISGAKQALNQSIAYAKDRRQFGRAIGEFGMIKHKLAEMSLRIFVGDAMVYRTLGEVDRVLGAVNPADGRAVLKAIEGFSVECSVNKVFTSEALAYVVDEALQVFGGNGYSREFPAERAYRDARITRIYEGTNEINRMLVSSRLLKGGVCTLQDRYDRATVAGSPFAGERNVLGRMKSLALALLTETAVAYGDQMRDQQEVQGYIADVVIDTYAIESAVARAEKLSASRGLDGAGAALDMVRVYVTDAVDRVTHAAKQVLRALGADRDRTIDAQLSHLGEFEGVDSVAARRRIADAVVAAGKHPF